jgi:hypothetical protein
MGTWDWSSDNFNQPTFAPLWSQEFGTDLWRTPDGIHWQFVSKTGMGDGNNTGSRSFASTPFGLYMGTARSVGGTQVFQLDNSTLDLNRDGVIDLKDVYLMAARVNTKALPKDPMDLNQDGKITRADVQLLQTQCTYPNCAVPPIPPTSTTLPTPVLYSAPGPLGGPVSLSWSAVSGAVDYLVYRIAVSPSQTTAPPGLNGVAVAQTTTALFGYPGPPQLLTRVTNPAYSETSLSTLQSLYFVRAEDASGNLSSPSNVVGGPSLAAH